MNRYIKIYFLTFGIMISALVASAQPGEPGDPDNPVPITGIEILIAAGGLFGAKKIHDNRKRKSK